MSWSWIARWVLVSSPLRMCCDARRDESCDLLLRRTVWRTFNFSQKSDAIAVEDLLVRKLFRLGRKQHFLIWILTRLGFGERKKAKRKKKRPKIFSHWQPKKARKRLPRNIHHIMELLISLQHCFAPSHEFHPILKKFQNSFVRKLKI